MSMENRGWQRRAEIMLCYPFEEKRLKRWNTPAVYTQPKLNGERCRIVIDERGMSTLYSSEVNIIQSVPHINFLLDNSNLPPVELDGELYIHGMALQDIHSIVSRKVELHPSFETMEFHLFDLVIDEAQISRVTKTEDFYKTYLESVSNIHLVPTSLIPAEAEDVVEQMLSYCRDGYEGVIVRSPFGHYTRRRSIDVMKFKPRETDQYVVVGYEEEISKDGVPKNSLGALILKSDESQIFKVGTGSFLTRENRRILWEIKESLKGQIAVIQYQNLSNRKVPLFPVLIELLSIPILETKSASGVETTTPPSGSEMPVETHTQSSSQDGESNSQS